MHVTAKLKALRKRAGLSMLKIAKLLGYAGASSYQRYEDPAYIEEDHLPLTLVRGLLETLLGLGNPPITAEEVMALAGLPELTAPQLKALDEHNWVLCIGEVAADVWRKSFEWPRQNWRPIGVAVRDERYPKATRRALLVSGDSMDEIYPEGSYVIFVSLDEVTRKPQSGDRVIAVRRRQDLIEATVKVYRKDAKGRVWLTPRSTNPEHSPIRLERNTKGANIEIIGLVVGSQRLE